MYLACSIALRLDFSASYTKGKVLFSSVSEQEAKKRFSKKMSPLLKLKTKSKNHGYVQRVYLGDDESLVVSV